MSSFPHWGEKDPFRLMAGDSFGYPLATSSSVFFEGEKIPYSIRQCLPFRPRWCCGTRLNRINRWWKIGKSDATLNELGSKIFAPLNPFPDSQMFNLDNRSRCVSA